MIGGLLAGTAMTAVERQAGRFLRAPDGHPVAEAPPAPAAPAEPAPAAAEPMQPVIAPGDAMANFENEFGSVVIPGEGEGDGEPAAAEEPGAEEPGVQEPEPKDDLEARLEVERKRADAAEAALKAAEAKGKEPPKDDAKPELPQDSDPAPKPEDYEFGEADSKFIADIARWNARQEFAEMRAQENLKSELDVIENGWKAALEAEDIKTDYPDFDEVVTQGAAKESWECTPLMALGIKSSPVGPDIAYELAKNPEESKRIASLVPVEQAFEIGKIAGRHAERRSGKASAAPATPAKVASSAPPPPPRSRGVGGQYSTELGSIQDRMLKEFR